VSMLTLGPCAQNGLAPEEAATPHFVGYLQSILHVPGCKTATVQAYACSCRAERVGSPAAPVADAMCEVAHPFFCFCSNSRLMNEWLVLCMMPCMSRGKQQPVANESSKGVSP
jgi:hypothetical protein